MAQPQAAIDRNVWQGRERPRRGPALPQAYQQRRSHPEGRQCHDRISSGALKPERQQCHGRIGSATLNLQGRQRNGRIGSATLNLKGRQCNGRIGSATLNLEGRQCNGRIGSATLNLEGRQCNGRIGSARGGYLLPAALRHMDGAATAGLSMDVRRGAQCAPAGARCREEIPTPGAANHQRVLSDSDSDDQGAPLQIASFFIEETNTRRAFNPARAIPSTS
jgi:hypothetical protein